MVWFLCPPYISILKYFYFSVNFLFFTFIFQFDVQLGLHFRFPFLLEITDLEHSLCGRNRDAREGVARCRDFRRRGGKRAIFRALAHDHTGEMYIFATSAYLARNVYFYHHWFSHIFTCQLLDKPWYRCRWSPPPPGMSRHQLAPLE